MFIVGGLHSIRSCWEKKKVCGCVIIDCPAYMRQEYCHAFSLGSGFSISICCYYTRPYIIGSCSNSSATIIHHHHCIYLARSYYLYYTGVDSLKGWVSRRKCTFPDDVPQCYSLTCAYALTFAAAELYSLLPAGRGCWFLGSTIVSWFHVSSIAHIWAPHVAYLYVESRAGGGGSWVPKASSSTELGTGRLILVRSDPFCYMSM